MSGNVFVCSGTYQGLPIKACSFRRSAGFAPDTGWVDMDLADVKKIAIPEPRGIPWRAINDFEMDGMMSIHAYHKTVQGTTVSIGGGRPAIVAPADGGLAEFGDLVFVTKTFLDGKEFDSITYKNVHVDDSGFEEMALDLAQIEEHSRGTVRVPLTDIRRWYKNYSPLLSSINLRLRNGEWDRKTLFHAEDDEKGRPWTSREVLMYLFAMLPGTPAIYGESEFFADSEKLPPPTDIRGEGEPIVEHLERLLDKMGYIPQMLPDNNWMVNRRLSKRLGKGLVATAPGTSVAPTDKSNEVKTVWVNNRPPAVVMVGPRRIRRRTVRYVPILQDADGRWYRLEDLLEMWGYSLAQLSRQVMVGHEKRAFLDLPPGPMSGKEGTAIWARRVEILKRAYHCYGPDYLFPPPVMGASKGLTGPKGKSFASMTTNDFEGALWLPMTDFAVTYTEIGRLGLEFVSATEKNDLGSYVISAPVIRARRIGQRFFTDIEAVAAHFTTLVNAHARLARDAQAEIALYDKQIKDAVNILRRGHASLPEFGAQSALDRWMQRQGKSEVVLDEDVAQAAFEVGEIISSTIRDEADKDGIEAERSIKIAKRMKDITATFREAEIVAANALSNEFNNKFRPVYNNQGGMQLVCNIDHTALEDGVASLDPQTGIVTSGTLLALMDRDFVLGSDVGRIIGDGAVSVTFGYELNTNSPADFTTILAVPSDTGDDPLIHWTGLSRSSPIKCKMERIKGRLYETDLGAPVNGDAIVAEALGVGAAQLQTPKMVDGYTYQFSGLRKVVLDGGSQYVQHEWDGDIAHTFIAVNAPRARLPGAKGRSTVTDADVRAGEAISGIGGSW